MDMHVYVYIYIANCRRAHFTKGVIFGVGLAFWSFSTIRTHLNRLVLQGNRHQKETIQAF